MKTIHEYTTHDKSSWPRGEWDSEPDKVQGIDEATGLDCLIVRNHGGALCGYVGVPESHPWFGKAYGKCTLPTPCEEVWCGHAPASLVEVHGGLTFANRCTEATPERWEQMRERIPEWEREAVKYPVGDAARSLKEVGQYRDDFEGYQRYAETRFICHIPQDGASDNVWWFGFDCAHLGDVTPSYTSRFGFGDEGEFYRGRRYVEGEIAELARQLAAIRP